MFNLKSVYFYFLAIQITLIKLIKRIYFSTNFYNKSLISKTPHQFYFSPNPFLLSSITNYKKILLKSVKLMQIFFGLNKKKFKKKKNYIVFFG